MVTIVDTDFAVTYYSRILTPLQSQQITDLLDDVVQWNREFTSGRRSNCIYGDTGLIYTTEYGGYGGKPKVTLNRAALDWQQLPLLIPLRDLVSGLTGEKYNFCIIQRYPSGRVGIDPHRDKEMVPGTTICGFSFGATRTLTLRHRSRPSISIPLYSGSLYILHPPTNDYWTHSIDKDNTIDPRYSLTFRNVPV